MYYGIYIEWGNALKLCGDVSAEKPMLKPERKNCVILAAENPKDLIPTIFRSRDSLNRFGLIIVESRIVFLIHDKT